MINCLYYSQQLMFIPAEAEDIPVIITAPLHDDKTGQRNAGTYMSCNG